MSDGSPTEAFGPYLVYEQLGVGGMAQVHRAVAASSEFQRPVALKRMLSHIANSEEMVRSFVREARLASYLRHENVAQTYDLGRVGDIYFIVMELVTGRNLREVLRHCGATTGPMPVPIALHILNQICDALDYAHNLSDETGQPLGIIHRDVSPSNVIVSDSGVVKLIDFGIAKASGGGMQTMGGTLKGKFAYMAPEYIAGRIDARADLFALGVIAHELLTNRPLFSGRDDIDTLTRVRDMHIAPPSHKNALVPPEIDDVVMTALERDPDRRWQHATALRNALTTLTKRLGLIATNGQVIQWLDWAFAQPRPKRGQPDTDRDEGPLADEQSLSPSIEVEPGTVEVGAASKKVTLIAGSGSAPPAKPPVGTPAYVPAQHSAPHNAPGRDPLAPRATTNGVAPPRGRSPSSVPPSAPVAHGHAPRPRPASIAPSAAVPIHRTHPASVPPPVSAQTARPHTPSVPPPLGGQVPTSSAPLPVVPARSAAPFAAPRPAALGSIPMPFAPERAAMAQRELGERMGGPAPVTPPRSPALTVVLVILAAAVAATTVYFVLPLVT